MSVVVKIHFSKRSHIDLFCLRREQVKRVTTVRERKCRIRNLYHRQCGYEKQKFYVHKTCFNLHKICTTTLGVQYESSYFSSIKVLTEFIIQEGTRRGP